MKFSMYKNGTPDQGNNHGCSSQLSHVSFYRVGNNVKISHPYGPARLRPNPDTVCNRCHACFFLPTTSTTTIAVAVASSSPLPTASDSAMPDNDPQVSTLSPPLPCSLTSHHRQRDGCHVTPPASRRR